MVNLQRIVFLFLSYSIMVGGLLIVGPTTSSRSNCFSNGSNSSGAGGCSFKATFVNVVVEMNGATLKTN